MIIAQITDFHVRPPGVLAYGGIDTNAMLRNAVAAIARLDPAPDCVIATGDLADCGLQEEYEEIASTLAPLPMPVFVIPGNHDRRAGDGSDDVQDRAVLCRSGCATPRD